MSQDENDLKRRKLRTAMFLLATVVGLYLIVILKEWT